jgi:hypothetical protein
MHAEATTSVPALCEQLGLGGLIRLPDDQAGLMGFGHQWKSTLLW